MHVHPLRNDAVKHPQSNLVMTEGELPPIEGSTPLLIAPLHRHLEDPEIFYVLQGTIGFLLDEEEILAFAGDAVLVPPGTVHTWWNAANEPARYLLIMPTRLDDLIIAIHKEPRTEQEMRSLFANHATEYLGWPDQS